MHMAAYGGPADESDPDGVGGWARRMSPADNEIPASVGMTALLIASDDVAVAVTAVDAYSSGFRFALAVRLRRHRPELAPHGLFELIDPHVAAGSAGVEQRLLLGLEYADGRRASTLDDSWPHGPGAPGGDRLLLIQSGGSGGETSVDQVYWVTPLPPEGPVSFIVSWPVFGVTESRVELDGAAILEAASRSRVLWPPQPLVPAPEPPPPPRPTSGWFARPPS